MDRSVVAGNWDIGFREISIIDQGDVLLLTCPDGPAGYEGRLVEIDEDRLRIEGGPLHGAELVIREEGPSLGGHRPMSRLERPAQAPPGSGLLSPPLEPSREEESSFEHLWDRVSHPSRAPEVDLGGVNLCRFVQWVTSRDLAVFAGSNLVGQERLQPAAWPTQAMGEVGNGEVVYANQDGLCSMFSALVDQDRAGDGARHRVERFYSPEGGHVDLYHFSLPRAILEQGPFRSGGLYLLPRERFQPVPLYPGGPPSTEWICPEAVRPLACLTVAPDDFPLRDGIGSYDDG